MDIDTITSDLLSFSEDKDISFDKRQDVLNELSIYIDNLLDEMWYHEHAHELP